MAQAREEMMQKSAHNALRPRAVFGKGYGVEAINKGYGQLRADFNTFRNKPNERPGTPIPCGERPADRPFAEHLGETLPSDRYVRGFGQLITLKTIESEGVKLKKFSWEKDDV